MHCLDCALAGRSCPSVAICTSCGAAACLACVRIGRGSTRHVTGFSSADLAVTETRLVACKACANALSARHALEYGFAPAVQPAADVS
ncbi:hypothetical protein DMP23_19700 [Amycolatopsis sp. A1MSW2902]|uniref:hypothetical protein n=1 Tax=Amycolatopsis sp. A1MSW2902 TaxID=687413 RepID=UPI00307F519D